MESILLLTNDFARTRSLKLFAIFFGALCGAATTQAAVIFYKPTARIRLSNLDPATQDYNIDLNSDGIPDLQHDSVGRATFLRTWPGTRVLGLRQPYVNVTWYDSLPYALAAGTIIGADSPDLFPEYGVLSGWQSEPIGSPGAGALHVRYDSGTSGFFFGTRGYIGVEFLISGQVHYGWVDLSNPTLYQSEIHGWAYESEPGVGITAGAIPEPSMAAFAAASLGLLLFRSRRNINIHKRSYKSATTTTTSRIVGRLDARTH